MNHPSTLRRGVAASLLAATAAAVAFLLAPSTRGTDQAGTVQAGTVQAGTVQAGTVQATCDGQVIKQPFMPWADPAGYVLVPNGTVERGTGWKLEGGAARAAGNEIFHVHDDRDATSLTLPAGSSATTAPICVGLEHPTLRLFARNRGSMLSELLVEVLFQDADGRSRALPIGAHLGSSSWQPTAPLAVVANLFALPGGNAEVAFRFTPTGAGDWSIDDVYVDPFRHG